MEKLAIIDDEPRNIQLLKGFIEAHLKNVEIIWTAHSKEEGIELVSQNIPDIIFLDIQLGDGTGFDFLEEVNNPNISIIFTTAYTEYTIDAFKLANYVVDYIVKPINITDVIESFNRVSNKKKEILKEENTVNKPNKILIRTRKGTSILNYSSITHLSAEGRYTNIHLINAPTINVAKNLNEIFKLLDENLFIRVHKSFIVNFNYVKDINLKGEIKLTNRIVVPVSRTGKKELLKFVIH